jgi:dihydrofolate reductase
MLSIIVAKAKNNIIGNDGRLLWSIPNDIKRFKELTEYHTVIMGRKTFESFGGVLPNRKSVVLTHNMDFTVDNDNVEIVHDINDLKEYINYSEECFVIGGGLVYKQLLPYTEKMYVTEIDHDFEGDTVFPRISEEEWEVEERMTGPDDERFPYRYEYVTYVRKK